MENLVLILILIISVLIVGCIGAGELIDCGNDVECLRENAQRCSLAVGVVATSNPSASTTTKITLNKTEGKCKITQKILDIEPTQSYLEGKNIREINLQIEYLKKSEITREYTAAEIGPGDIEQLLKIKFERGWEETFPSTVYGYAEYLTSGLAGFCGNSVYGHCINDADCITDGCSGEVCRSKFQESVGTPCAWLNCFSDEKYGVECKCVNNKCQWLKTS